MTDKLTESERSYLKRFVAGVADENPSSMTWLRPTVDNLQSLGVMVGKLLEESERRDPPGSLRGASAATQAFNQLERAAGELADAAESVAGPDLGSIRADEHDARWNRLRAAREALRALLR